jgi:hypothetical protein
MTIEQAFRQALVTNAGVSALLAQRVYPLIAPETAAKPFVVYTMLNKDPLTALSGALVTTQATVEVDCVATTYLGSKALADAVRSALAAWTGGTSPSVTSCTIDKDMDALEFPVSGDGITYHVVQDYTIWYAT